MNNVIERKWCTKGTVYIEDLTGTAFTGEDGGHTFVISGVNPDGTSVTLAGTVAGAYILPDGSTQPLTGSIVDGKAQVTLDPECYALPGRGQLTVFLTAGSQKVAIYGAVLNVARSSTDQVPPAITADVADLVNDIEEARATIPASYTDLMASLAKNYADLTYPISAGTYAWQNGWMYRAKVDIPSAESWTASHWEKVPLADSLVDEFSALKSALTFIGIVDYAAIIVNNWIISTNNTWTTNPPSSACVIPLDSTRHSVITVTPRVTQGAIIAFLNTYNPVKSGTPDFAIEYPNRVVLSGTEKGIYVVHEDMHYMYVLLASSSGEDRRPLITIGDDTDGTLTKEHIAADAKAVREAIDSASETIQNDSFTLKTGYAIEIENGTDYDEIVTPGNYRVRNNQSSATMKNCPVVSTHRLTVFTLHKTTVLAQFILATSGDAYYRLINVDTHNKTDWLKVLVPSDIPVPQDVPAYVISEADAVSQRVRNVQTGNSITFVACSDLHYAVAVGSSDGVTIADSQAALKDMRDAIVSIAKQTHIDFYACFGDVIYQWQAHGANYDNGVIEMTSVTKLLNEAFGNNPQVRMVGNHDPNCENNNDKEFGAYLLNSYIGIYSDMLIKDEAQPYGAYGYHDFERQKVRLIILNTSFYTPETDLTNDSTRYYIGNEQAYWLCEALDLSNKNDASDWQIIICSHVALDQSNQSNIRWYTSVLNAYEQGGTWAKASYRYSFSGKNLAKLVLYMNGHSHMYNIKNMRYLDSSGTVLNTLPMVNLFVPNALPGRDFESFDGVTYSKITGTSQSTAFQIITFEPVKKLVYAHHYGAGIDIILHYEPSTNGNLSTQLSAPTWASVDSTIATVEGGVVTPVASGYTMVYAKSAVDNTVEAWNYHSEI